MLGIMKSNTPTSCLAALNGQIDIVKILVEEFHCSPFVQGFRNRTLLHAACLRQHHRTNRLVDKNLSTRSDG